jgi:hypothetical protein
MVTGLVSTTATNPVDVVKTHMFTGEEGFGGGFEVQLKRDLFGGFEVD